MGTAESRLGLVFWLSVAQTIRVILKIEHNTATLAQLVRARSW